MNKKRKEAAEKILKSAGITRIKSKDTAWKKRVTAISTTNLMKLPREGTDLRIRNWSDKEKAVVLRAYKEGKSLNYLRGLIGCSFSPIIRMLNEEGVIKPQHQHWIKKK